MMVVVVEEVVVVEVVVVALVVVVGALNRRNGGEAISEDLEVSQIRWTSHGGEAGVGGGGDGGRGTRPRTRRVATTARRDGQRERVATPVARGERGEEAGGGEHFVSEKKRRRVEPLESSRKWKRRENSRVQVRWGERR